MNASNDLGKTADLADLRAASALPAQTGRSSEQVERDYTAVRDALAAKPALLQAILNKSLRQNDQHAAGLNNQQPPKTEIADRLSRAEQDYQAILNEKADRLLELFKQLPIDRKLDLLLQAEKIGEINDQAREQAREKMQAARAAAMAAQQAEVAHNPAPAPSMGPRSSAPWSLVPQPDHDSKVIQRILQPHRLIIADEIAAISANPPDPAPAAPKQSGLTDQISIGSPAAFTANLPFTAIPGLPALNTLLQRIDRMAHLDLGFTIKGVADREANPAGGHDLVYRLSYVGAGIMSSKFNMQLAPLSVKLEEKTSQDHWGGSSSVLAKRRTDLIGEKFTVGFGNDDVGVGFAPEANYQTPSNRIISNLTGGRYFGNDGPAIRIPAEYVPSVDRVVDALPSKEEAAAIFDRVNKVIPINQMVEMGLTAAEDIARKVEAVLPSVAAAKFLMLQNISTSGHSPEQQAKVMALIHEKVASSVERGVLPNLHIHEKITLAVTDPSPPDAARLP